MAKKKRRYSERYELLIPPELKGRMDPDFIRWAVRNKWLLIQIRGFIEENIAPNGTYSVDIKLLEESFKYNPNKVYSDGGIQR
jgi:hypothetical protein